MPNFDFSESAYTKMLWESRILPYWSHCDRPVGQRFLGSNSVQQDESDRLLAIISYNLKRLDTINYKSVCDRFSEPQQNWLKIITFAFSEYAYYYSKDKFWQGLCQHLQIPCSQTIENTFREITEAGIQLLGLIKIEKSGYRYVSTLWLQSGIPKQNLPHFAQLVEEILDEYEWWDLSHADDEDISQELLDFCQDKHPQWKTLIHFLKSSCCFNSEETVEPISGQLLQGIATVAQVLERKSLPANILLDDNQREQLLGSYYLPQNFFLRNWDSLIQVLTPKQRSYSHKKKIIGYRKKPLSIFLDIADSLDIQLILPEQNLSGTKFKHLSETFCQVLECKWESNVSSSGVISIPEQVVTVRKVSEFFHWQLLDHRSNCLIDWQLEGIAKDFPCLIFDAWSGDRLNFNIIKGINEIYCFIPQEIHLSFADGIEILDTCVPCSIKGYIGQHIKLMISESSILFTNESNLSKVISWKLSNNEYPQLTGLKLKGKKSIYIDIPIFWHPPTEQDTLLNILIEDIDRQKIINTNSERIVASNNWQPINLSKWIAEPGVYKASFWCQLFKWSYCFEFNPNKQLSSLIHSPKIDVTSRSQGKVENLPIACNCCNKFWAEIIEIDNLWTLENVNLTLCNSWKKVFYLEQVDALGKLCINLAMLQDLLPSSDWYSIDYQQLGSEKQRLIEMEADTLVSWTLTDKSLTLNSLQLNQLDYLACWNLFSPNYERIKISIPLSLENQDCLTLPLILPPGIYFIQLHSLQQSPKNIGWWCGISKTYLNQVDKGLENYCYNILNNEPLEEFVNIIEALNIDWDLQWLQITINSLINQTSNYYFPEWLNYDGLVKKLQFLIQPSELLKTIEDSINTQKPSNLLETNKDSWYLLTLTHHSKRKIFCKQLTIALERDKLQSLFLNVAIPSEAVYQDLVLLELSNFKTGRNYIQNLEYVKRLDSKPLQLNQVNQMLKN